jgi:hypothetical protein
VPRYDLEEVKQAALAYKIEYRGRKVQRDIANLGYQLRDVVQCLAQLRESDFSKSIDYKNGQAIDDVYIIKYPKPNSEYIEFDSLYVKFCLINGNLSIELASFHLD